MNRRSQEFGHLAAHRPIDGHPPKKEEAAPIICRGLFSSSQFLTGKIDENRGTFDVHDNDVELIFYPPTRLGKFAWEKPSDDRCEKMLIFRYSFAPVLSSQAYDVSREINVVNKRPKLAAVNLEQLNRTKLGNTDQIVTHLITLNRLSLCECNSWTMTKLYSGAYLKLSMSVVCDINWVVKLKVRYLNLDLVTVLEVCNSHRCRIC